MSAPDSAQHDTPEVMAVIDCGTSSIRATIAEQCERGWRIIEEVERPVDLYPAISEGSLNRGVMDALVEAMTDILHVIASFRADRVRAVATSALRAAANTDVVLERLRNERDIELELIDGPEEGRLYFQALSQLLREENEQVLARPYCWMLAREQAH